MQAPTGGCVRPASAANAASDERRCALRGRQRQACERRRVGDGERQQHARLPGAVDEPPQSGNPIAPASDEAATTTPATPYERPSPRTSSTVASGAMPTRAAAPSSAAADDAPDAGRAQHVAVAAQARRLLARLHGGHVGADPATGARAPAARSRARSCPAGTRCRWPRAARDRRAGDVVPSLSTGATFQTVPPSSESNVPRWRSPMRTSASARPSLANANWSTTAPRSSPAGRTRFHVQSGVGRAVERSEGGAVGGDHQRRRRLDGIEGERVAVVVELRIARSLELLPLRAAVDAAQQPARDALAFLAFDCTSRISVCCLPEAIASAAQCHGRLRRGRRDRPGAPGVMRDVEVALAEPGRARIRRIGGDRGLADEAGPAPEVVVRVRARERPRMPVTRRRRSTSAAA